ncbi:MAG: hypothetical protein HOA66_06750 [Candidatus Marinimicrobia bacterium]|jgi:hypothetical protein|nr:hypothetical protein [Candidatus Neomarinimicrobiota bacterium]
MSEKVLQGIKDELMHLNTELERVKWAVENKKPSHQISFNGELFYIEWFNQEDCWKKVTPTTKGTYLNPKYIVEIEHTPNNPKNKESCWSVHMKDGKIFENVIFMRTVSRQLGEWGFRNPKFDQWNEDGTFKDHD